MWSYSVFVGDVVYVCNNLKTLENLYRISMSYLSWYHMGLFPLHTLYGCNRVCVPD